MINSYSNTTQAVAVNGNVLFNADRVRTNSCQCGGWLAHDLGSGIFTLTKCGIYEISYNGIVSSATTGVGSLALEQNGEVIIGSESDVQVTTANDVGSVAANVLVRVPCGASYTITLTNNSDIALNVTNANIVIERLS